MLPRVAQRRLILWLALLFTWSPQAIAQEPDGASPIRGVVVDETGQPVEAADVALHWYEGRTTAKTDKTGHFVLDVPYTSVRGRHVRAADETGQQRAYVMIPWADEVPELRLELRTARLVTIFVADGSGKPLAGAKAGILVDFQLLDDGTTDTDGRTKLWSPADAGLTWVYAFKENKGFDYRRFTLPPGQEGDQLTQAPEPDEDAVRLSLDGTQPLRVRLVEADSKPISGLKVYPWLLMKPSEPGDINLSYLANDLVSATTDADGWASWSWIPAWNEREITVWPHTDRSGSDAVYARKRGSYDPRSGAGELILTLDRLVQISGRVSLPDGTPAQGIAIQAVGASYDIDGFRGEGLTDADGRYVIKAAPNMVYLVVVRDSHWASEPRTGFAVWPGKAVEDLDFDLRPATRVYGRVTVGPQREPVKGQQITLLQSGKDVHGIEGVELPNPERSNRWVQPQVGQFVATDDNGQYELFVGAGDFRIRGPSQSPTEKFTVTDQSEFEFNFHAPRKEKGILEGTVVTGDPPRPVPDAQVSGIYRHPLAGRDLQAKTNATGHFQVERELHRTVLRARSSDGNLAGVVQIEPDQESVAITMEPVASARGRLVDEQGGSLPDREIVYGVRVYEGDENSPFRTCFGGKTTTDAEGRFAAAGLVVGQEYEISVTIPADENQKYLSWRNVGKITPADPSDIDLGDLQLKPIARPPTTEERIDQLFLSTKTPLERFELAIESARIAKQRIAVLFATPEDQAARQLLKERFEDSDLRQALEWFQFLLVDASELHRVYADALAARLEVDLNGPLPPLKLSIAETDGGPLATVDLYELAEEAKVSKTKLIELLGEYTPQPLNARDLLNEALAQAEREDKRVIVQETATWCGPCWLLSRFFENHQDKWAADFILVKMDHRWAGAAEIMKEYRGEAEGGLPWWAVLDAKGNLLVTSNDSEGNNIGFPGDESGRDHFRTMIQSTAQRLSAEQISALIDALENP